jgi:hypothetical protein
MAFLRLSRAKHQYRCYRCSAVIGKGQSYYRLEPHPIARIKRGEEVRHLCLICVRGQENLDKLGAQLRNYWIQEGTTEQLSLPFEESIALVETKVYVADTTSELLRSLRYDPSELHKKIYSLTDEAFELFICELLEKMGLSTERVGSIYQKDGGIDILAWYENALFPSLLAIQAKHHRLPKHKTGPGPVRELQGVVQGNRFFTAGVLVTNTTFTPDAKWVSEHSPILVCLRDMNDIQRWLLDDCLDDQDWREIPDEIEVCRGVVIPRSRFSS